MSWKYLQWDGLVCLELTCISRFHKNASFFLQMIWIFMQNRKKLEDQLLLLNNRFIRLIWTIVFYYDLAPKVSDNFLKFFSSLFFYL